VSSYKPITNTAWVRARPCKLHKRCIRLAAASDKVYQLLIHGRWFSPTSSTTKTGRHDIAESGVKTPKINHTVNQCLPRGVLVIEIKGTFYLSELQKVDARDDGMWKIEKILQTKGKGNNKHYFPKWLHRPKKFNSWTSARDVNNL